MNTPSTFFTQKLTFTRQNATYSGGFYLGYHSDIIAEQQTQNFLHTEEKAIYADLEHTKRRVSYLLGRHAAKKATVAFIGKEDLSPILVRSGIFTQPLLCYPHPENLQVTISHSDKMGASIVFPEAHPMGIDIEKVIENIEEIISPHLSNIEKQKALTLPYAPTTSLTVLWTAKEALSKVLKTGLTASFEIFEVEKVSLKNGYVLISFKHFIQYQVEVFAIPKGEETYVCAVARPGRTAMNLKIAEIQKTFTV